MQALLLDRRVRVPVIFPVMDVARATGVEAALLVPVLSAAPFFARTVKV